MSMNVHNRGFWARVRSMLRSNPPVMEIVPNKALSLSLSPHLVPLLWSSSLLESSIDAVPLRPVRGAGCGFPTPADAAWVVVQ